MQKPAPAFKDTAVVNGVFDDILLADYDRVTEFRNFGGEVIACSTDSQYPHLVWINTPLKQVGLGEMNSLAEKSMKISRDYSLLDDMILAFPSVVIHHRQKSKLAPCDNQRFARWS